MTEVKLNFNQCTQFVPIVPNLYPVVLCTQRLYPVLGTLGTQDHWVQIGYRRLGTVFPNPITCILHKVITKSYM